MNYIKDYFKDARAGDEVVDIVTNEVGIIETIDFTSHYPILVKFSKHSMSYTVDGRKFESEKLQRLFYKDYTPKIEIPEPPKRKFKFEYGKELYIVLTDGTVKEYFSNYYIDDFIKYGKVRRTKEAAEQALRLQTRIMRLHALAEQLGGLISSSDTRIKRWTVVFKDFDYPNGEWVAKELHNETCITVEMTEECAEKICEMLNSGEFSLEV